jgi:HlyD family secretion protein
VHLLDYAGGAQVSAGLRIGIGLLALGGLMLIGAAGYFGFASSKAASDIPAAAPPTVSVTRGDVDLTVTAPGSLVEASQQAVRSEVDGQIADIAVQAGDVVQAGDLIATLDAEPLKEKLQDAQRSVEKAEDALALSVSSAQSAVIDAQNKLAEVQLQYPGIERMQIALNQARTGLEDAQAALHRAQEQEETARQKRDQAQNGLNDASHKADDAERERKQAKKDLERETHEQSAAQDAYEEALDQQTAAQNSYDDAVANNEPQPILDGLKADLNAAKAATADAQDILGDENEELADAQAVFNEADADYQTKKAELNQAQAELDQAEAAYQQAIGQVAQAQTILHNAEYGVQLAELDLDDERTNQKIADQQIAAAQRAVDQAKADLAYAQSQTVDQDLLEAVEDAQAALDAAAIYAPVDGQVQEVHLEPGALVTRGQAVITLTNPRLLEASTTVIEEDLPLVQIGQKANLFFDAAPDAEITGTVDRIVPERTPGSDRPLYTVYVTIDGALPEGLLPGMNVEGSIIIDHRESVLILPRSIVQARSNGTAEIDVWTGTAVETRTVQVGLRGDVYVEILSGLTEGDQVVAE